jgi:hypothetical protein
MSAFLLADVTVPAEILSELFAVLSAVGSRHAAANKTSANVGITFDILAPRT